MRGTDGWLRRWLQRIRIVLFRREAERAMADELRFHLEKEAEALEREEGLSPAEARREARVRFGGEERWKERARQARGTAWWDALVQDVSYGLRTLGRSPGFTAVVVVTLALGIGANTAIFGVVKGVLLEPLPFPSPDRVIRVYQAAPARGVERGALSLPNARDWRDRSSALVDMGVYTTLPGDLVLQDRGGAEEVSTAYVAGGFFAALGVDPILGRPLLPRDEETDPRVAVLGHAFWRRAFGADSSVVGRTVTFSHTSFTVVGVMPRGFSYPGPDVAVWVPVTIVAESAIPMHDRQVQFLSGIGRLRPGVEPDRAREELTAISAGLEEAYPDANAGRSAATVVRLRETVVGEVETALWILLGAVGLILLIACTNVANLMLARGARRRRELAIRHSLGASSARVTRQLLTESLLLGGGGGAAGVAVASWGAPVFLAAGGELLPRASSVSVDAGVLPFAVALTLLTVVLFGLVPARRAADVSVPAELREGGRRSTGGVGAGRLRRGLVAGQVGLTVVLLVAAGLLVRSLDALGEVDPGFRPEGVVAMTLTISGAKYPERADWMGFYHRILERAREIPGVESVGSIKTLPLRGHAEQWGFSIPGIYEPPPEERTRADVVPVSRNLFRTLGIDLLAGRGFRATDGPGDPGVVVINRALAREYFGDLDPVGRTIAVGPAEAEVVGIVEDVRQRSLAEPAAPTIYVHQEQMPRIVMAVVARAAGDPGRVAGALRRVVVEEDPEQAVSEIVSLEEVVRGSTARSRFFGLLLVSFALLATVIAAAGIYGVVAYAVRARVPELGLRVALGARGGDVARTVLLQAMAPVVAGAGAGLVGAATLSRVMEGLLFRVRPLDPTTYAAVAVGVLAVALAACALPTRSATRADPMTALRAE